MSFKDRWRRQRHFRKKYYLTFRHFMSFMTGAMEAIGSVIPFADVSATSPYEVGDDKARAILAAYAMQPDGNMGDTIDLAVYIYARTHERASVGMSSGEVRRVLEAHYHRDEIEGQV